MLKNLRKTKTALAMAAALGAVAMMPQGQAANVAVDGLSDMGFVPYYTVRAGWNSYIHLTNTSPFTAILKVRWREARNSREVRDFNLILSPYDVWTAAVTPNDAGDGAMVKTDDNSCTAPQLPALVGGFTGIDFTNAAYDGRAAAEDGGPTDLDRTKEGYFEFFLMALSGTSGLNGYDETLNPFEWATEHDNTGVPNDCAGIQANFENPITVGVTPPFDTFAPPGLQNRNVIAGLSTLINVADGQAVGLEPTMIANCVVDNIYRPGDQQPTAGQCQLTASEVIDNNRASSVVAPPFIGAVLADTFASGQDAVSAAIQRSDIINEWTTAAATNARTDWITTFPTKHHYVDGVRLNPFTEQFDEVIDVVSGERRGESCDPISITLYDREEQSREEDVPFSPVIPGEQTELCNEVNIITFNGSDVFSTSVPRNIDTTGIGDRGWARIGLLNDPLVNVIPGAVSSWYGLPVIGTAVTVRNNPTVTDNNRNYASAHAHKYQRDITVP